MKRDFLLYLILFCTFTVKGWAQETFMLNVGSTGYATVYYDKALSFESFGDDLKAYGVSYVVNGVVTMSRVDVVPAYTGVVVKTATPGTYQIPVITSQNVLLSLLKGVLVETELPAKVMKGSTEYTNLILGKGDKGVAFYKVSAEGGILGANKAYLQLKSSALPANSVDLEFDDHDTDMIEQVESNKQDGAWYTLQGVAVPKPTAKGVYVHQGKKVVVR